MKITDIVVLMVSGETCKITLKDKIESEVVKEVLRISKEGVWNRSKTSTDIFYPPHRIQQISVSVSIEFDL